VHKFPRPHHTSSQFSLHLRHQQHFAMFSFTGDASLQACSCCCMHDCMVIVVNNDSGYKPVAVTSASAYCCLSCVVVCTASSRRKQVQLYSYATLSYSRTSLHHGRHVQSRKATFLGSSYRPIYIYIYIYIYCSSFAYTICSSAVN